nr:MAG TPA: hypothetical protein [Caudoviricetes sp.]
MQFDWLDLFDSSSFLDNFFDHKFFEPYALMNLILCLFLLLYLVSSIHYYHCRLILHVLLHSESGLSDPPDLVWENNLIWLQDLQHGSHLLCRKTKLSLAE